SVLISDTRRRAAALTVLRAAHDNGYTISRTKLAKLLYLADLAAVQAGRAPVSGVEWKWLDYGPFNIVMYDVERALARAGLVKVTDVIDEVGTREKRLTFLDDRGPRLPPDEEKIVVDMV